MNSVLGSFGKSTGQTAKSLENELADMMIGYDTNSQRVDLSQLHHTCLKDNVPCISPGTEEFLRRYIQQNKPKYIGEIGSARGYSALVLGSLVQKRGGSVWSVEHSFPDYQQACHNARAHKVYNVTFYHSDANIIEYKKLCGQKMDFIYIDGRKHDYLHYLECVIPIVAPHTTIIFDDVIKFAHKTTQLYEFLQEKQIKHTVHQLDPDDGILLLENAGSQLSSELFAS